MKISTVQIITVQYIILGDFLGGNVWIINVYALNKLDSRYKQWHAMIEPIPTGRWISED